MKNGFTKTQTSIIESVKKFLATGEGFRNAVVMTSHELGFNDWYIEDTYNSYKQMEIMAL